MSKLCKCTHWDVQHWQEDKLPTHCDMGGCECQSFEEYQSADLTTKLSRYEAMMAEIHGIDTTNGISLFKAPDDTWSAYDGIEIISSEYPSPLEAFEALQKERV